MDVLAVFVRDLGPLVAMLWLGLALLISLASPFFMVAFFLNIRDIRRALQRIADAHESQRGSGSGGILGI